MISQINHKIRTKLKLTCDEYVLVDYLYTIQLKKIKPSLEATQKAIGFDKATLSALINTLVSKGVYVQKKGPSDLWSSQFNYEGEFEAFWEVFLKHGNKATSKIKYCACRKIVDREVLIDAAEKYIKSKEGKERHHVFKAETWLNPINRHWEDVITLNSTPSKYIPNKKELT